MSVHSVSITGQAEIYLNKRIEQGHSKSKVVQDALLNLLAQEEADSWQQLLERRLNLIEARQLEILEIMGRER